MITNKIIKNYTLQLDVIKLMYKYKRKNGLSRKEKLDLKSIQRYFNKLQNCNTIPDLYDIVITEKNINYYKTNYEF